MKSLKRISPMHLIPAIVIALIAAAWACVYFSSGDDPMDLPVSTPAEATDAP